MPEDWLNQQPCRDTTKVPAVVQLPGEPFPSEFYARYPEAFRMPVRLVWRDGPARPDAAPPRPTQAAVSSMDATPPVAAAGYQRPEPIGAYLRV
jgi:hypothetical protein